jgi:hypothetical protein
MLETLLKVTGVLSGWCEKWLLIFYHYRLPHSSTKHTVVMFTVTVSWPCILTSMWYQAFISSELYIQSHAVLSVSQLLCKTVLKMANYMFWEYLILNKAHDNGAAAVSYPQWRLPKPWMFHTTDYSIKETGTVRTSTVYDGKVQEQLM